MQTIALDNPVAALITARRAGARRTLWTGRVISGRAVALLIFDSVGKLLEVQPVIDGTRQLGYPPDIVFSPAVTLPWRDRSQS